MTPLPDQFADRWSPARERSRLSYQDAVCWHILLGADPGLRAVAEQTQQRLARTGNWHPTPARWLHVTVLRVGAAPDIPPGIRAVMIEKTRAALSGTVPPPVTVERVLYHPEAIALKVSRPAALAPLRDAVTAVTSEVTGTTPEPGETTWTPHLTLAYSTGTQPAGPVIAEIGKTVPPCTVTVRRLSLVVQNGPENQWDWTVEGSVEL